MLTTAADKLFFYYYFNRKILKDLSSEDTRDRKGDEESPGVSTVTSMSVPTPIYQTSTGQYSKLYKIWGHIVTKLASKYRLFVCLLYI